MALNDALRSLYGTVGGGGLVYRLLQWDDGAREGVLAVEGGEAEASRLQAAATLLTSSRGEPLALHFSAKSPFLLSVARDSRAFCAALLDGGG